MGLELITFGHACIFLGIVAASLGASKKRYLCLLYVSGIALEAAIRNLYDHYGILEDQWEMFYLCIAMSDLIILSLITHCYHRDYILVYPLIFLMVCLNATIPLEWVLIHSTSVWSISETALHALNIALLLILFGKSDGTLRLITEIRHRLLSNSIEHSNYRVCVEPSEGSAQEMERGKFKT